MFKGQTIMKKEKEPKVLSAVILSANLGSYDPELEWVKQTKVNGTTISICRFNDKNFPGRDLAMTPRLKPALIKMFGWQFMPGFDFYIWVDGSRTLTSPDFGYYMLHELGDKADLAIFKHPDRKNIFEEYGFMKRKMAEGSKYLLSRYQGEWLEEQYRVIMEDEKFKDEHLYASTAFAYRPTTRIKQAFKEWWYHKTRYLLHDQIALPYVLAKAHVKVNEINGDIYKLPYWEYTRKRK